MNNFTAKTYISFLTAEAMLPVIEKVHQIRGITRECYEQESERTLGNSYRILMISPPNKDEDDEGFSIAYKEWLTIVGAENFIDCNHYTNGDEDLAVKLFLALAEMDLNKPETLYYAVPNNLWGIQGQQVGGFIVKHCDIPKLHLTERHYIDKHNPIARPEELAEAIMYRNVKL